MQILEHLGVALGLATLAGVNLYLTVLITGLAIRFNILDLAAKHQELQELAHPAVLMVAGVLFVLEFFADKVPWVDSLWDAVHTFIRPVGGVLLGLAALGDVPVYVQVMAALVAGGATLTTHGAKAGTRLMVNHSPEPVSNVALSVTEDVAVTGGTALTLLNPVLALIVFACVLLVIWLIFPRIWRGIRATSWLMWNKMKMPGKRVPLAQAVELKARVSEELRDLLKIQADVEESDVTATVRCLSGRSRGVKGLSTNLDGVLVLTAQKDRVFFAASKGLSDRVFDLPLLGAKVCVESKFLSENLVFEMIDRRIVLRFPRGRTSMVETLSLRLNEMVDAVHAELPPSPLHTPVSTSENTKDEEGGKDPIFPIPAVG